MRSIFAKAVAVLLLSALIGIPWGFYSVRVRNDAQTLPQGQWLVKMEHVQTMQANGIGFTGTLVFTLFAFVAFTTIYEAAWRGTRLVIDQIAGQDGRHTASRKGAV